MALTPPVPASRLAAFANEPFETWASPSFSATLHQSQIAAFLPSAATHTQLNVNSDASGRGWGFGPDGTVEKAGERPDFRSWHFAVVRLARKIGEMNSGENRCRTPELFRRASIRRGEAELPKAGASAVREWNHTPEPPSAPVSIQNSAPSSALEYAMAISPCVWLLYQKTDRIFSSQRSCHLNSAITVRQYPPDARGHGGRFGL